MSSSQLTNSSFFRGVGIPPTSLAFCYKWNRTMTSKKIPFSMDYQRLTMHIVGAISTWVCLKIWGKPPTVDGKIDIYGFAHHLVVGLEKPPKRSGEILSVSVYIRANDEGDPQ